MRNVILVLIIIGALFISGCLESPTGNVVYEEESKELVGVCNVGLKEAETSDEPSEGCAVRG